MVLFVEMFLLKTVTNRIEEIKKEYCFSMSVSAFGECLTCESVVFRLVTKLQHLTRSIFISTDTNSPSNQASALDKKHEEGTRWKHRETETNKQKLTNKCARMSIT